MTRAVIIAELGKELANWVIWLWRLGQTKYYGSVTLKFENGRIVSATSAQTHKADEIDPG